MEAHLPRSTDAETLPSLDPSTDRDASATDWHEVSTQLRWFIGAAAIAFAVPFVGTSLLDLHHDLYLLVYIASVLALIAAYVRRTHVDVGRVVRRNLPASLIIGLVLVVPLIRNVLSEDVTARPDGLYFVFELVLRGGLYGAVDALLLTALPCMIVLSCLGGNLESWRRKGTYFVASIALIMAITATYHLGYEQFREDGVRGPETGNVLMSLPTLLTANPVGSVIDHSAMHIAAVTHEYETDLRLPPQTDVERAREP